MKNTSRKDYMTLGKPRLLIYSNQKFFLKDHKVSLESEFEVQWAPSEQSAHFLMKEWNPLIWVLDGSTVENFIRPPAHIGYVVVLGPTGVNQEAAALRSGADHVLPHSFPTEALMLRIRNLINRLSRETPTVAPLKQTSYQFMGLEIFPQDHLVKRGSETLSPSPTQMALLTAFIQHQEQLLTRDWLKENVWQHEPISLRSIDAQVSKLKKLLPELEPYLINVYGRGYVLTQPKADAA